MLRILVRWQSIQSGRSPASTCCTGAALLDESIGSDMEGVNRDEKAAPEKDVANKQAMAEDLRVDANRELRITIQYRMIAMQ